jgi:hypothetical protein
MGWCAPAHADEVDDILALKAKNRDRIKSYSAEYVVETELPKGKNGATKTSRMRYRMRMERLPKGKAKGLLNPWKTEIDVLEPYALSMKVEGERVWLKKGNDWAEQEMAAQMREQFTGMGERFLGPIRPNRGSTLTSGSCGTIPRSSVREPGPWNTFPGPRCVYSRGWRKT